MLRPALLSSLIYRTAETLGGPLKVQTGHRRGRYDCHAHVFAEMYTQVPEDIIVSPLPSSPHQPHVPFTH